MEKRITVIGSDDLGSVVAACVGRMGQYADMTVSTVADVSDIRMLPGAIRAATGADALVLSTDWPQFITFDLLAFRNAMRGDLFFDGRMNCSREQIEGAGFEYIPIQTGRAASQRMIERSAPVMPKGVFAGL